MSVSTTEQSIARRLKSPLLRFAAYEPSSGMLLLAATVISLVWANTGLLPNYADFWGTEIALRVGDWTLSLSLHDWIDDALMALFFFHVSLEVKHEVVRGALSSWETALMPAAAALGGMLLPALVYLAFNAQVGESSGWAVPMATDVAFAIALLSLLGPRVPAGLRAFLLTLAVVDDIGTIGVIALFYSSDIATTPLLIAAAGLLLVLGMRGAGVRSFLPYWVLGAAIWLAMEKSGVHPTVAGVALGLLTPLSLPTHQQTQRERAADRIPHLLRGQDTPTREFQQALDTVRRGAFAPLDTLRFRLEPWVLYLIMPLFALANAGVEISGVALLMQDELAIFAGVGAGLILGKPLGIVACAWLAAWLLKARLPDGTGWLSLAGAAWLAGVGFTVALFLTSLAFERPEAVAAARLGVLAGSFAAAAIGLTLLWKVLPSPKPAATSSRQHR